MPQPISNLSFPGTRPALDQTPLAVNQESFAAVLGRAGVQDASKSEDEQARTAAEQLVAQTFLLPLLKQLRESDHAAPPFAPTQGEQQLRALQDADLAQRIAHATHFPLVDRLARDLLKRAGKDAAGRDAMSELNAPSPPTRDTGALNRAIAH